MDWKKVTPDMIYKFINRNTSIKHDKAIDFYADTYTKKEMIDELRMFGLIIPAKHIINMYSKKKVTNIDDAGKRIIAFASYYLNMYRKKKG